jgi:hypothetical protein
VVAAQVTRKKRYENGVCNTLFITDAFVYRPSLGKTTREIATTPAVATTPARIPKTPVLQLGLWNPIDARGLLSMAKT